MNIESYSEGAGAPSRGPHGARRRILRATDYGGGDREGAGAPSRRPHGARRRILRATDYGGGLGPLDGDSTERGDEY